ncbi:MAG: TrbG/VirB9 family P-type conjugative transfer protein [Bryobacterales bacterium]|nr:TrbG/VirB9 family P-type conjugative transfer protein [Bryobacterales bacterium]
MNRRRVFLCLTFCTLLPAADPPAAKVVQYGERDIVPVNAKIRYTTLLVLPKQEQILDFTCGDKEFWIVNGSQNFAYLKPAKPGSRTNLNLITASGNIYSFVVTEVSDTAGTEPDLKVFVEPKEPSMIGALQANPRFVPAEQLEDFRQQVEIAKAETRQAKEAAQAAIEAEANEFRSGYPGALKFPYRFEAGKPPFDVKAIFHDGKFTYIQAQPQETPALYELKDGKPNLIQFQFKNGSYVVAKVLASGYLTIGKQKLSFLRVD